MGAFFQTITLSSLEGVGYFVSVFFWISTWLIVLEIQSMFHFKFYYIWRDLSDQGLKRNGCFRIPRHPYKLRDSEQVLRQLLPSSCLREWWQHIIPWRLRDERVSQSRLSLFCSLSTLIQKLSRFRFLCLASNLQFSLVDTEPEISVVKFHLCNCHLPASKPPRISLLSHLCLGLSLGRCYEGDMFTPKLFETGKCWEWDLVVKSIVVCQFGVLFRKIIIIRRSINK